MANKKDNKKNSNKVLTLFRELIAIVSWVTVILLWLSAASVYINPEKFSLPCLLGLGFPFFLAGVLFMLVFSMIFAFRKSWIPLLGLILCFFSIRSYAPINIPCAPPKDCYKVLTYNTMAFATVRYGAKSKECEKMMDYVVKTHPDFFFFQEGGSFPIQYLEGTVFDRTKSFMPYHDTIQLRENILGCCSRYPIVKKELICRNLMNGAAVYHVLLKPNDTLRLVNCHLQSMGLTGDEREQYHNMVKHPDEQNVSNSTRLLASKITKASAIRSEQAIKVAEYVEKNKGKNIILCGDFNDTPISFARHIIASTGLTDAYQATANGIGRTFNRDAIYVRIDHIFCSEHWRPYSCHIDRSINISDHYPMICYLKRQKPHEKE